MKFNQYIRLISAVAVLFSVSGCWVAAAGAGAEVGYVASQEDRTAGETIDDQRITSSVKTKLLADSEVSGLSINVDTFKRVVTLNGTVASVKEADKAISLAKSVSGVRDVNSKLIIE